MQWIDQDPGRQWTSSINPIIKKPEDFYGEYYVPFGLGIPCDIETTMRLARKFRKGSFFAELPTDLFKLILIYVLRAYTYNIPRKPNAWEPAVVQPTTQPSKVEKPLDYFSELALANGGDLRPKGKREQREEDQRLRNLLPAAQVNFPAFNVLGQQQFQPQFHQQFQPLGQQRFQPQQNNQTFEDSSDDDEREETNNPTTIPNIRIPTASFSESPYNILYDPLPRTILENDLPSNLLIIGIGLYLDEDTGIVYSKFNNAWMITGRIDN
jgi:hypothetical protein